MKAEQMNSTALGGRHPRAAYVHIPFCRRRCYYCDFPISVVGDVPPLRRLEGQRPHEDMGPSETEADGHGSRAIAHYIDTLCQEIAATPVPKVGGNLLETVFFGGGTPSLLSSVQLDRVLHALDQRFGIASTAEISMEMDPGTFTLSQLRGYTHAGINRISLGAQAFQPELLALCGRTHTPDDIQIAIEQLHRVNVSNISLDLISGLPHQTLTQWHESLESALKLHPTHLSIYDLTIEPTTAFSRQYAPGVRPLPSDETTAEMYRLAQRSLTQAGFDHYEVSNYARPGYRCRHNQVYWQNCAYYGFGMGATSYVNGQRFSRPRTQLEYRQWVAQFIADDGAIACPTTSEQEALLDTLMLGLRLSDGVDLHAIAERFGDRPVQTILTCLETGYHRDWVEFLDATGHPCDYPEAVSSGSMLDSDPMTGFIRRVRLTDPEGFLFSNVVLSDLFSALQPSVVF